MMLRNSSWCERKSLNSVRSYHESPPQIVKNNNNKGTEAEACGERLLCLTGSRHWSEKPGSCFNEAVPSGDVISVRAETRRPRSAQMAPWGTTGSAWGWELWSCFTSCVWREETGQHQKLWPCACNEWRLAGVALLAGNLFPQSCLYLLDRI